MTSPSKSSKSQRQHQGPPGAPGAPPAMQRAAPLQTLGECPKLGILRQRVWLQGATYDVDDVGLGGSEWGGFP